MKNFQPGGLRNRKPDLGGRPRSDVNSYAPKSRFDAKPAAGKYGDKKDVTLYKTTCTTCGAACEVPFRPDGTKPVLCRDCFASKNAAPTNSFNRDKFTKNELVGRTPERRTDFTAPRPVASQDFSILNKQLAALETKVSQILELIQATDTLIKALPSVAPKAALPVIEAMVAEVSATPTKVRKPKKETPAVKKAAVKKKAQVAKKTAKKAVTKTAK